MRWVVGGLITLALLAVLSARGPLDDHPSLAYDRFLADFQAGQVQAIIAWRDVLEVDEAMATYTVRVPPQHDLEADLGRARVAGVVGISISRIPELWLPLTTPLVPVLLLLAAALILYRALRSEPPRGGRAARLVQPVRPG